MANIKSSAKRDLKSKQQRADNRADMTELKTKIKKFDAAVAEGNKEAAADAYKTAVKAVDKAAGTERSSGVILSNYNGDGACRPHYFRLKSLVNNATMFLARPDL